MTKRLICLVLSLLMVLAVLTSCGEKGDAIDSTVDKASRFTSTMNFWLITESPEIAKVSELMYTQGFDAEIDYEHLKGDDLEKYAAAKAIYDSLTASEKAAVTQLGAVNKAINKITKEKFKTQIKFRYVLASEYYTKLEKAFADRQAAKNAGTLVRPGISESEETVLNEYGIPELKYPTTPDYQVDILFLDGADRYRSYADAGLIASMDAMLEDSSVQLSYYVSNVLMSAVKYRGMTYAVPNGNTIGEYVYLAVDTKLASDYNLLPADFGASLYSAETYDFLNSIYERNDGTYPLYCDGDVDLEHFQYWSFDLSNGYCALNPNQFSLFGSQYDVSMMQGGLVSFSNILTSDVYKANLTKKVHYETTPNFLTADAAARTAMRVVKGGYETKAELEAQGYSVLTVDQPRVTDADAFGSMFAIGANTGDSTRAMEIITYINTNAELRNLLQYGVEDINYTLATADDGESVYAVETADNVYKMDIAKTGNVFIAYPNSKEAVAAWAFGKEQNRFAATHPSTGLFFDVDYASEDAYKLLTGMNPEKDGVTRRKVNENCILVVNAVSAAFEEKVIKNLSSVNDVANMYKYGDNKELNYGSTADQVADCLLEKVGTVTYRVNGADVVITKDILVKALKDMVDPVLPDEIKPGQTFIASPAALYEEWRLTFAE